MISKDILTFRAAPRYAFYDGLAVSSGATGFSEAINEKTPDFAGGFDPGPGSAG
jgi:hypothetical protein